MPRLTVIEAMNYFDEMLKTALKLKFHAYMIYSEDPEVEKALEEVRGKINEIIELIERIKPKIPLKPEAHPTGEEWIGMRR